MRRPSPEGSVHGSRRCSSLVQQHGQRTSRKALALALKLWPAHRAAGQCSKTAGAHPVVQVLHAVVSHTLHQDALVRQSCCVTLISWRAQSS